MLTRTAITTDELRTLREELLRVSDGSTFGTLSERDAFHVVESALWNEIDNRECDGQ